MDQKAIGRKRGLAAAAGIDPQAFIAEMNLAFEGARRLHPTAGDMDYASAIRAYEAERLASQPDPARFPELKGHIDLLTAERAAFREATGLDETASAYRHSWWFFITRRMGSRHLARYDLLPPPDYVPPRQCTNVFFPHGADGVTMSDNRDDVLRMAYVERIPAFCIRMGPEQPIGWCQGGVSASILLDDEPACSFPASPFEYKLMPDECHERIDDMIEFLSRYQEFWGPGNKIIVDRHLNAAAVDKSNCQVAFRKPTVCGAVAITACAYIDDALHARQMEGDRRAMAIKGETEADCPDMHYHLGSRERYRRLVDLTDREAARPGGATLWGALEVVADHAVPFPARVCIAGEKTFPEKEPVANWSITQHAIVATGPKRRALSRSIQDLYRPQPVYTYTPKLSLAPGVRMEPEWQADIDAGRCTLVPPLTEPSDRGRASRTR